MDKYILVHGIKIASDFVPETFGRLTTIGPRFILRNKPGTKGQAWQICMCNCSDNTVFAVRVNGLKEGRCESCGCLHREKAAAYSTKHGLCSLPEYGVLKGIVHRCSITTNKSYSDYGGRGIGVCARWREPNGQGLLNFIGDMGPRPGPEYTVERKDNDGDYCPENCKWATTEEQSANKRNTIYLSVFGEVKTLVAWSKELGISDLLVRNRLRAGWTPEKSLLTPPRQSKHK